MNYSTFYLVCLVVLVVVKPLLASITCIASFWLMRKSISRISQLLTLLVLTLSLAMLALTTLEALRDWPRVMEVLQARS